MLGGAGGGSGGWIYVSRWGSCLAIVVTVDRFDVVLDGGCLGPGESTLVLLSVAKALVTADDIGGKLGPVEPFVLWYMRLRFAASACSFVGVVSGLSVVFISKLSSGARRS